MGNFTSQLVVGGSDENVLASLQNYTSSSAFAAKNKFIEMVIQAFSTLGMPLTGNTNEAKFKNAIENIKQLSLNQGADSRQSVLVNLGRAINKISDATIINISSPPAEIARQIHELLDSVNRAIHLEFLHIHNQSKKLLTNLKFIQTAQTDNLKQIREEINKSTDPSISTKLARQLELAELVLNESGRQVTMLANIISSTLDPDSVRLADLVKTVSNTSGSDFESYVSGDRSGFARLVKDMLTGFGKTAQFADYIQSRLQKIGMTLKEYAANNAMTTLNQKISEAVTAAGNNDARLEELISVAKVLRENISNGFELAQVAENHKFIGAYDPYSRGLASDDLQDGITQTDKRIARQKEIRNIILGAFARRLQDLFRAFISSLFTLSEKVGTEIVADDNVRNIADSIARFGNVFTPTVNNASTYYSLIGVYRDAMSLQRRDTAIGEIAALRGKLDSISLAGKPGAEYFSAVSSHLDAMQKLIDQYSHEITVKFGGGECDGLDDRPVREQMSGVEIDGGCDSCGDSGSGSGGDTDEAISGGASCPFSAEDYSGGADPYEENSFLPRTFYIGDMSVTKALDKFRTNISAALIRSNIRRSKSEVSQYGDKYNELLETSIAEKMIELAGKAKEAKDRLAAFRTANPNALSADDAVAAEKIIDRLSDVSRRFWSAIETIEKYLAAFTVEATDSENLAQNIQSMLDGAITTEDWYRPESGDILAAVFDHFPSFVKGNGDTVDTASAPVGGPNFDNTHIMPDDSVREQNGKHYYEKLLDAANLGGFKEYGLGGHPGNPTMPKHGEAAMNDAGTLFKNMSVVKWIIAIFTKVIMKNESKIISQMSMPPAKLRLVLEEFVQVSTFAIGYGSVASNRYMVSTSSNTPVANYNSVDQSVSSGIAFTNLPTSVRQNVLKQAGIWMPSVNTTPYTGFLMYSLLDEQKYFTMAMKSIVAKVLVMIGRARLLEEPGQKLGVTPLRLILGGSGEKPKIEDGAVELYLRLPLLLQFYHEIFGADKNDAADYPGLIDTINVKIGLLPDIDGPFSNLIRICFRKPDITHFSDGEIEDLIREVNAVYNAAITSGIKPAEVTTQVISQLVDEINRRYGVVSLQSRQKMEEQRLNDFNTNTYSDTNLVYDAPVLEGEEDDGFVRPSGAERLLESGLGGLGRINNLGIADVKRKTAKLQDAHRVILDSFRASLDRVLERSGNNLGSFRPGLAALRGKLKRQAGAEERVRTVATFLRNINVSSHFDNAKTMLFHETVVTGLATLSGVHSILARFKNTILGLDIKNLELLLFHEIDNATIGSKTWAMICDNIAEVFANEHIVPAGDSYMRETIAVVFGREIGNRYPGIAAGSVVAADGSSTNFDSFVRSYGNFTEQELIRLSKTRDDTSPNGLRVQAFVRRVFDREEVMRLLIEAISTVTGDTQSLVSYTINDGRLQLRFGDLAAAIEEMFASVQYFINLFRAHISHDVIEKYTNKMTAGSFFWLHEQLMEKIIRGRKGTNVSGVAKRVAYANLDDLSSIASKTFEELCRPWKTDVDTLAIASAPTPKPPHREMFGRILANFTHYDAGKTNSGVYSPSYGQDKYDLVDYKSNPFDELHITNQQNVRMVDTRYVMRNVSLYSWNGQMNDNKSLLFTFNDLISKFLYTFYDTSSRKIYGALVNVFANSTFSKNVQEQRYTFPDTVPNVIVNYQYGETVNQSPVAAIMRELPDGPSKMVEYENAATKLIRGIIAMGIKNYINNPIAFAEAFCDIYVSETNTSRNILGLNGLSKDDVVKDAIKKHYLSDATTVSIDRSTSPEIIVRKPGYASLVARYLPFLILPSDNSDKTIKYNAQLFAVSIIYLKDRTEFRSSQKLQEYQYNYQIEDDPRNALEKLMQVSKIYQLPGDDNSEYMVRYDDFIAADQGYVAGRSIARANGIGNLVLARDKGDNVIPDGSINRLGIEPPAALPAAWNDINNVVHFGQRADPDGDHVLFTSLSVILKTITKSSGPNNSLLHIVDNIADVPVYIKERLRANLPGFKNLFQALIRRAELLKNIMNRSSINAERQWSRLPGFNPAQAHNPWPWVLSPPTENNADTKHRFIDIIDAVIRGSQSFVQSCDTVLRELGGEARFLETFQGSARDYKTSNGVDPLSPFSTLCAIMSNSTGVNPFLPFQNMGEPGFKFAYGTRSVFGNLTSTVGLDHFTGFIQTIDHFNLSADQTVDRAQSEKFATTAVKLLRFIFETKHLRASIMHYNIGANDLVATNQVRSGARLATNPPTADFRVAAPYVPTNASVVSMLSLPPTNGNLWAVPPYSVRMGLADSIRVLETISRDEKISEMLAPIIGSPAHHFNDQLTAAAQNILDLGIVPINIHALMRGIPLANLYNYSYTFDKFVAESFVGEDKSRNMFYQLITDPFHNFTGSYNEIEAQLNDLMTGRIFPGDMGRPRFLGDQVYNKALLHELYSGSHLHKLGPGAERPRLTVNQMHKSIMESIDYAWFPDKEASNKLLKKLIVPNSELTTSKIRSILSDHPPADQDKVKMTIIFSQIARRFCDILYNMEIPDSDMFYDYLNRLMGTISQLYDSISNNGSYAILNSITIFGVTENFSGFQLPSAIPNLLKLPVEIMYHNEERGTSFTMNFIRKEDGESKIVAVQMDPKLKYFLGRLGMERFNTPIVRNICFLVLLFRFLRYRFRKEAEYSRDSIRRGIPATNARTTEAFGNE